MEDRYLFKAKTAKIVDTYNNDVEDGVWVHGSLRCDVGKYTIFQFETERADYVEYEIDPSTICQCTGLKDKNGKLIWENDILECTWDGEKRIDAIEYQPPLFTYTRSIRFSIELDKVIGNIFDNPELLESEE
jgi:hypothetical protein